MADAKDPTSAALPLKVPEWLRRASPRLAEALPAGRLPPEASAILREILSAPKIGWAWAEITRTARRSGTNGNRYHPLTVHNAELVRRMHNTMPADVMGTIEQMLTMPGMEVREGIFAALVLCAAIIGAIPCKEDFAPELRDMLAALEHARETANRLAHMGFSGAADGIADAAHLSYCELKERLPIDRAVFRTRREREETLSLYLASITRGNLSGHTLHQTIATIASAALERTISKAKVQGIVKRKTAE